MSLFFILENVGVRRQMNFTTVLILVLQHEPFGNFTGTFCINSRQNVTKPYLLFIILMIFSVQVIVNQITVDLTKESVDPKAIKYNFCSFAD